MELILIFIVNNFTKVINFTNFPKDLIDEIATYNSLLANTYKKCDSLLHVKYELH